MKIWVIGRSFPFQDNGMKGSFELEQAKMIAKYGMKVCYLACCFHPTKTIKKRGFLSWQEDDIDVYTYSAFFFPRVYPFFFNRYRCRLWFHFFETIERISGKPDIIHVHYPSMLMIADVLNRYKEKGVKIIATEHWTKVLEKRLNKLELLELKKYKSIIDAFICVGYPLAKIVSEVTGIHPVVVPNIVNSAFRPTKATHTGFRFVAVGRLVKVKQFDKIIRAFSESFKGNEKISLTIVGDGKQKKILQKLIDKMGIEKQIKLKGCLGREETADVVANSDSLICYSKLETFGVPVIEAWACGLPVITTTAVSVMKSFDSKLGIEICHDNIIELKHALIYIYNHIDDYDKNYISKFAVKNYSEKNISDQLFDIYYN